MKIKQLVPLVLAAGLLVQPQQVQAEGFFKKLVHNHHCKSTYLERQKDHVHITGRYDCTDYDTTRREYEQKMARTVADSDKTFGTRPAKAKPKGFSIWGLFQDAFKEKH